MFFVYYKFMLDISLDLLYDIGGPLTYPGTTYKIIVAEKRGSGRL